MLLVVKLRIQAGICLCKKHNQAESMLTLQKQFTNLNAALWVKIKWTSFLPLKEQQQN